MFNGNGKEARIIKKLDELAALEYKLQLLEADMWKQLDEVIPEEVLQQMDDIKAELQPKIEVAQAKAKDLWDTIKKDVINLGVTVKGDEIMAVYSPGRQSWDTKALMGYAEAHKKIKKFLKTGNPSVARRPVQKKED